MERYVGLDSHARRCTLGVMSASGQRLKALVVETNGSALIEAVRGIPGRVHLCLEEGTQSAWLSELLRPHVAEVVVAMAPERKGPKDDQRASLRLHHQRLQPLPRSRHRPKVQLRACESSPTSRSISALLCGGL